MKKIILYILFLAITTGINAQDLTISPDPVIKELTVADEDVYISFTINNNTSTDKVVYWDFVSTNSPEEWELYICDNNLCYTPAVTSCPCNKPNVLLGNSSNVWKMNIIPNGVPGTGVVELRLIDECESTTTAMDIPITFMVEETTSTSFGDLNNNINIYPNPSSQNINIKEDAEVKEIIIYNLIGKKIRRVNHTIGQSHDISDLDRGIYLIRMLNKEQNILKVSRLTKR